MSRELHKLFLGLSFTSSFLDFDYASVSDSTVTFILWESILFLLSSDDLCIQNEDWLFNVILELVDIDVNYSMLFCHINFEMLSSEGISLFVGRFCYSDLTEDVWRKISTRLKGLWNEATNSSRYFSEIPPTPNSKSPIVSEFPAILSECAKEQFTLLYRGSSDGCHASSFHRKCDGYKNTITIIQTKKGNIFGGDSPCVWDSNGLKRDESGTSFIVTLKNPHLRDPRIFRLRANHKHEAIFGRRDLGVCFGWNGGNQDFVLFDSYHTRSSYSSQADCVCALVSAQWCRF